MFNAKCLLSLDLILWQCEQHINTADQIGKAVHCVALRAARSAEREAAHFLMCQPAVYLGVAACEMAKQE